MGEGISTMVMAEGISTMVTKENPSLPRSRRTRDGSWVFCVEDGSKTNHAAHPHTGISGYDGEPGSRGQGTLCMG